MTASRAFRCSAPWFFAAAAALAGSAALAQGSQGYPAVNLLSADYRLIPGSKWGVEMGVVDLPRFTHLGSNVRSQGLNLSLVGRAPLFGGLGLYGRLGTTYGYGDSAPGVAMAGSDNGSTLTYGAGVSLDFTRRLSATVGWESHDFRFTGGLRATSLGLQYRY